MDDLGKQKSKEIYEFKKHIKQLTQFRGRGTELISVYIAPGTQISDITSKLKEEAGQATNIKSTATRKNVQGALEKILSYLKTFKEPPKTGMAVFAGNVSDTEGKSDIELYSIIPPVPLQTQFYRCEPTFVLEPLKELVEHEGAYGLVVMDGKEATVALLRGKNTTIIKQIHSTAHAKTHKGGQSSQRFQRLREEGIEYFHERIGEAMDAFLQVKNFKGIIVGGPGPAKEDFVKAAKFNYQLKILGIVDTGYTDEYGIREVLEKGSEIISEQEAVKEKKLLDEFLKEFARGGAIVHGYNAVKEAIESNKAGKLLVSEDLSLYELTVKCSQCGEEKAITSSNTAHEEDCHCGGKVRAVADKDLVNEIIGLAEERGVEVEMISRETAEGSQFYGTFGGLGAFLRYK